MNTTFLIFMTISIFSFGAHSALMSHSARKLDGLTVTAYRGLSLILAMLPLLLLVPVEHFSKILSLLPTIFFASLFGFIAFAMSMQATKFLPIAASNVIRQAFLVTTAVVLGYVFFGETLSILESLLVGVILISSITVSLLRTQRLGESSKEVFNKGIFLSIGAGVIQSVAFYLFGELSRQTHPFLAGFLWEGLIGILAFVSLYILTYSRERRFQFPQWNDLKRISAVSLLTVIATVSWGFAIIHGKLAIASAFQTLSIFVIAFFGWILFGERMTKVQIALIIFVASIIIIFKTVL